MENDREKYRDMSIEEREKLIENLFIMYPSFERCLNKIKECHEQSKLSIEPLCALITGEPGVGKTTLCEKYEGMFPRQELEEKTKIPVLLSYVPIPATPKNMVTALLASLRDPFADKGTVFIKTLRLFSLLKTCEIEIIIIDEFHHIIERDSDRVIHDVSEWLKQLINKGKLPIILVGLPHSVKILEANPQLARRFAMRDELTDFEWIVKGNKDKTKRKTKETKTNKNDYRVFLKIIDDGLPLAESSNLADRKIAYRMWNATSGNVNRTMKLIRYAAKLAINSGEERITLSFLETSYDILFSDDTNPNPFSNLKK